MKWFSNHGIGARIHAIEKRPDGRVEFTVWFTVFFIPLIPISSWSAHYAGELAPNGIWDEGHQFTDLVRIHRDVSYHIRTLANSLLVLAIAIAPAAFMIVRTQGRAATTVEMI